MLSLVPLRTKTSDKAELVTQLLFGECYELVDRQDNWLCVQLATDGYRGWIDHKQHTPVSVAYYEEWQAGTHPRATDLMQIVSNAETRIPVGIGSYLPFFDGIDIRVNDERLRYNGHASDPTARATATQLAEVAGSFLKAPYLWGGKSIFGIDCSGFVQQVYGICGYQLPRDACQQVEYGQEVHFATQTQPGDLAFFANSEGRITHVGLMLEEQKIMHAHGEVRIDTLDHDGIYNSDFKRYTHQLRIIRRIF